MEVPKHISLTNLGRNKTVVFLAITILMPFFFLFLLEVGLRFFGYGHDLGLFVEDEKNKEYLVMNPHASKRYFATEENATIGAFESFRKHKSPETFRIFVLGESTTLGYPYMNNASFHRFLLYRLMHSFPDKEFEIINLSLTAVNSYTVLGFAKELGAYEPDAVMIYCGQNEYYGTLGVGSTSRLGNNRFLIQTLLRLRSLRLVQLLGNGLSDIKKSLTGQQVNTRETLMKRMAAKQEIPINSDMYNQGIHQFDTNMKAVCEVLSKQKIPCFISNLVSNEKDLKPFSSSKTDTSVSSEIQYSLAEKAYKNEKFERAKKLYVKAKDFDMLRFRAPEAMNQVIENLPHTYPAVYLVDTKKIFEENSSHGILGNETLLEHVHPNIFGYGLMSEAFYQSIKQHQLIVQTGKDEISLDQLLREMPITKVDSLKGTFEISILKESWPFNQKRTFDTGKLTSFEEKMAMDLLNHKMTWNEAMPKLMNFYLSQKEYINATKVAESTALQFSNDATFMSYAGKFCMNLHRYQKAKVYFQHAFKLLPSMETAQNIAILYLKTDEPAKALGYLNYLVQNNLSKVNYNIVKSLTTETIFFKTKLLTDSANIDLLIHISRNYFKMQNVDVARYYAEKALFLDKTNKNTLDLLEKIKSLTPIP